MRASLLASHKMATMEVLPSLNGWCYIDFVNTVSAMNAEMCCCAAMCCAHISSGVRKWLG